MKIKHPKANDFNIFYKVLPSGIFFKFDLNIDTWRLPLGWSMYQLTNPEVSQSLLKLLLFMYFLV